MRSNAAKDYRFHSAMASVRSHNLRQFWANPRDPVHAQISSSKSMVWPLIFHEFHYATSSHNNQCNPLLWYCQLFADFLLPIDFTTWGEWAQAGRLQQGAVHKTNQELCRCRRPCPPPPQADPRAHPPLLRLHLLVRLNPVLTSTPSWHMYFTFVECCASALAPWQHLLTPG